MERCGHIRSALAVRFFPESPVHHNSTIEFGAGKPQHTLCREGTPLCGGIKYRSVTHQSQSRGVDLHPDHVFKLRVTSKSL